MAELTQQWHGGPMTTADLATLTGQNRSTLWRDRRAKLLPDKPRQAGVKQVVYTPAEVQRYLARKHPHLLPRTLSV